MLTIGPLNELARVRHAFAHAAAAGEKGVAHVRQIVERTDGEHFGSGA